MKPAMATKYLPKDRRDLTLDMVDHTQANFFALCVRLKLFKRTSVDSFHMEQFSRALYKLVMRRHTNLWNTKVEGVTLRELSTGTIKPELAT